MVVRGRKPSDGPVRHRHKPTHDWTEVEDVPFEDGPRLPRLQPSGRPWPAATRAWWKAVSAMPHCVLWTDSDWQFARDTAILAAAFHFGDLKQARELRQREKVMGTTTDALRDLRIRYVSGPAEDERLGVASIEAYKKRLKPRRGTSGDSD